MTQTGRRASQEIAAFVKCNLLEFLQTSGGGNVLLQFVDRHHRARLGDLMTKNPKSAAPEGSVLRDAKEATAVEQYWHAAGRPKSRKPPKDYKYVDELAHLQFELIKLQEWVRLHGLKVAVIFEGRDAAGKGGVIKRITQSSILASAASLRSARRPVVNEANGIFNVTSLNSRHGAKSFCSIAVGTIAPESSA